MSINRIASRYAKSLLELSTENGITKVVLDDIIAFKEALQNRDLYLLLKSPLIKSDKKEKIFKLLFEKKYDNLTNMFFKIVIKKGRESFLPEIVDQFMSQYKEMNHISSIVIKSAVPLQEDAIEEIRKQLIEGKITFENIEIETQIDPELIGGFIIEIGDKLYDASIKHKLEKLKKELSNNFYVS